MAARKLVALAEVFRRNPEDNLVRDGDRPARPRRRARRMQYAEERL
jgi:hypothetical protein